MPSVHETLDFLLKKRCLIGRTKIGTDYVDGVLKTELVSWESCKSKYTEDGSCLWVLLEEDVGVVGSVGIIRHQEGEYELVRMYVAEACDQAPYSDIVLLHDIVAFDSFL